MASTTLRIPEVLNHLRSGEKVDLKKLLPKGIKMPDMESIEYPSILVRILPNDKNYAILNIMINDLLRYTAIDIKIESLVERIRKYFPGVSQNNIDSLHKSRIIEDFLANLREMRTNMETLIRAPLSYDQVLVYQAIEGHPYAINESQLFVIKNTNKLKGDWVETLFEIFAYASMITVSDVYIVLPFQKTIWKYSINDWKNRNTYRDFLNSKSKKVQEDSLVDVFVGNVLRQQFRIGFHAPKLKTLMETIQNLPDFTKPYQIFLGGPQNTNININNKEIVAAKNIIQQNNISLYVHSQYIINLCNGSVDNWNVKLLMKNLEYASSIGCKGVVVHVGKSTDKPLPEAIENMKKNLIYCLEAASPSCPLLLETPAGQGTETLKGQNEFINFVSEIKDARIGVCLDTCHVYACGHKPLEYISQFDAHPGLLKLIHYNDSAAPCGSCVDRHAFMGTGHIGMNGMKDIAVLCASKNLPMVIE